MTPLYFWATVAIIAFLIGFRSRRAKSSGTEKLSPGKRMLRAIGSPIEFVLFGGLVLLLWHQGAFSGDTAVFMWGVFAMIAVPFAVVFFTFQAMGRSAGSKRSEKE